LEVATDCHEPMIPQHIMWPSVVCISKQLDPWCSSWKAFTL